MRAYSRRMTPEEAQKLTEKEIRERLNEIIPPATTAWDSPDFDPDSMKTLTADERAEATTLLNELARRGLWPDVKPDSREPA